MTSSSPASTTTDRSTVALFRRFPELEPRVPWTVLGQWPTAVEALDGLAEHCQSSPLYVKREDQSSPLFGGNKIRTLEGLFGQAVAEGYDRIWTTGAFGSNHSVAMATHAAIAGIESGALLFPQPRTDTAAGNLLASLSTDCQVEPLLHAATLPFGMIALNRASKRPGNERHYVMIPGGACPLGSLGHVSGALELAEQIEAGECPAPRRIVIAVGSTCTTAGLLVGLRLAARLGIAFGEGRAPVPQITAVRVTPWPMTSAPVIANLAWRTSKLVTTLLGDIGTFSYRELLAGVNVDRRFFGGGYGKPITPGFEASRLFSEFGGPSLDEVYSEKSASCFIELARQKTPGPMLYWATRSSTELPKPNAEQLENMHPALKRWLAKPKRAAPPPR